MGTSLHTKTAKNHCDGMCEGDCKICKSTRALENQYKIHKELDESEHMEQQAKVIEEKEEAKRLKHQRMLQWNRKQYEMRQKDEEVQLNEMTDKSFEFLVTSRLSSDEYENI